VYPEATWYAPVTAADIAEIIDSHLVRGVPVERLRFVWPAI
jgi:(2Fe-2S) ferredoxin